MVRTTLTMDCSRTLLASVVDYAGLFPPAELQMRAAVQRYANHRAGPYAWLLGRFVLPLAQVEEFEHAFDELPAGARATPWGLSVLAGRNPQAEVKKIADFNRRHGDEGRQDARIESIEMKVHSLDDVAAHADLIAEPAEVYFEVGIGTDPGEWVGAISSAGARAKVRTGGTSAELYPTVAHLARFVQVCAANRVAFKATAGLHHAMRGDYPVTPNDRNGRVLMHGFLNLFLAAGLAYTDRVSTELLEQVLDDRAPGAFAFEPAGVTLHGRRLSCEDVAATRRGFAISYGSCSIEDGIEDLRRLGLI